MLIMLIKRKGASKQTLQSMEFAVYALTPFLLAQKEKEERGPYAIGFLIQRLASE